MKVSKVVFCEIEERFHDCAMFFRLIKQCFLGFRIYQILALDLHLSLTENTSSASQSPAHLFRLRLLSSSRHFINPTSHLQHFIVLSSSLPSLVSSTRPLSSSTPSSLIHLALSFHPPRTVFSSTPPSVFIQPALSFHPPCSLFSSSPPSLFILPACLHRPVDSRHAALLCSTVPRRYASAPRHSTALRFANTPASRRRIPSPSPSHLLTPPPLSLSFACWSPVDPAYRVARLTCRLLDVTQLPICLTVRSTTSSVTCLSSYLPICPPAYLPICLSVRLPAVPLPR